MKYEKLENMGDAEVKKILDIVPELLEMPYSRIWTDYDKEVDVLYINFKKSGHADDSELMDGDMIVIYEKGEIIGITITNASKRGALATD
jgi:uncharacterized protein YuzE